MLSPGSYRPVATNIQQYCTAAVFEHASLQVTQKWSGDGPLRAQVEPNKACNLTRR